MKPVFVEDGTMVPTGGKIWFLRFLKAQKMNPPGSFALPTYP